MDITFAIVRAENADYLCHHANGIYVDVSNPMRTFVAGEDKFRLIEPDRSLERKEYRFRGQNCYLVPRSRNADGQGVCGGAEAYEGFFRIFSTGHYKRPYPTEKGNICS